jgi:malonate decarboxylase delta subunit
METLDFQFPGSPRALLRKRTVLRGVLCSGGLEVLVEPADLGGQCQVKVITSATGFGAIWKAVLEDALFRWPVADALICINDAGATPAVVSLRMDQALQDYLGAGT